MASGWGGLNNIIEEERKRKEEQAKREAMARALEQRQQGPRPQPKPLPNPWQAPVFQQPPIAVAQPQQPQPGPYENPYAVDTGPSPISSSSNSNDTVQSNVQQPLGPISTVAPRPMNPELTQSSVSNSLSNLGNILGGAKEKFDPWARPSFSGQPNPFINRNQQPYQLQSDEPYDTRNQIYNNQSEPVQNRIWDSVANSPFGQAVGQVGRQIGNGVQSAVNALQQPPAVNDSNNLVAGLGLTPNAGTPNRTDGPFAAQGEWLMQQPASQYTQQQFQDRWDRANDTNPIQTYQQVKDAPGWLHAIGEQWGIEPDAINQAWRSTPIPGAQITWAAVDDPLKYAGAIGMGILDVGFDLLGRIPASTPRDELGRALIGNPMEAGSGTQLPIMAEPLAVGGVIGQAIKENTYGNPLKFLWNLTVGGVLGQGLTQQIGERGNELFAADQYQANMDAWWNTKKYYDGLSTQEKADTGIGWAMAISGPNAVMNSITDVQTWDAQIAAKEKAAIEAQIAGDSLTAAQLGREINQMKNMSKVDIIEQHMNIGAELVYGILVDPGSWAIDLATKAAKLKTLPRYMQDADKVFNIDRATAVGNMEKYLNEAQGLLDSAVNGNNIKAKTWWDSVNPFTTFKRTPESKANIDTNWLTSTIAQVTQGVTSKDDARLLLNALRNDATILIGPGVQLSSTNPMLRNADNLTTLDPGVVGNVHAAQRIPILSLLPEDWVDGLRSLKGEGTFDPVEFLAEVDNMVFGAARRWNGLGDIKNVPLGTADTRVKRMPDGTAVIEYVGKDKKVISTSEAMTYNEAYTQVQDIKNAGNATNAGDAIMGALKGVANFQRGILADQYLALSPRNWIRNTLGAWTMAYSTDSYSWKNTDSIFAELARDGGGIPSTARPFSALTGYNRGQELGAAQPSTGFIGPLAEGVSRNPDNIVSRFMRGAYDQAYGLKEVPTGPGKSIGRSEESNFLKVFMAGYDKTKRAAWDNLADNLMVDLAADNVDANWGKALVDLIREHAPNSSQNDLINKVYDFVMGDEAQLATLNALGVESGLLPNEQWGKLVDDVLANIDSLTDEEAASKVMEVFNEARQWPANQLAKFPPQQGQWKWTKAENLYEGGLVEQSMIDTAARAGIPEAEAKPIIQQVTGSISSANDQWDTFVQDFGDLAPRSVNAGQGSSLYSVAVDFTTAAMEAKDGARAIIDKAARNAVALQTNEAWLAKWHANVKAWGDYGQQLGELASEYRATLGKVAQGEPYTPKTDFNKIFLRWAKHDPEKLEAARNYTLSSPVSDDAWMWEEVIAQNRSKVDAAIITATEAFRYYPTADNFDLLTGLMRQADEMGARAASFLTEAKAKGAKGVRYYNLRNETWNQYFDDAAAYAQTMAKVMVSLGVSEDVSDAVKWTDDFSGGEFRLLYPNEDGTWQAWNTATKEQLTFSAPGQGFTGDARPEVPQNVLDAYNTALGRNDEMVDTIMSEVQATVAAAPPSTSNFTEARPYRDRLIGAWNPEAPGVAQTMERVPAGAADEIAPMADEVTTWREPDAPQRVPGYGGSRAAEPLPQDIPAAGDRPELVRPIPDDPAAPGYVPPVDAEPINPPNITPNITPVEGLTNPAPSIADVRKAADEAGIATATKDGRPTDKHLINSINKRLGTKVTSLDDLTDAQRTDAIAAMAARSEEQISKMSPAEAQKAVGTSSTPTFGQGARTSKPATESMFAESGEDLPLMSGAAQRAPDAGTFAPQDATRTESMFDMRPQMSNAEGTYAPKVPTESAAPKAITIDPDSMTKKEMLAQYGDTLEAQGYSKSKLSKMTKGEIADALANPVVPQPAVISVGDVAKMEAGAAKEAQQGLKAEWDRVASGELGLPSIDTLVARFKRDGSINLNLNEGEVKIFEDLYGNTIASMPINNLDDVESYLRTYNSLGQQAGQAQRVIANSKQFAKMSAQEILAQTRDELVAAGYSDDEIRELAKDRRGLLDTVATIRGDDPDEFGLVGYDFAIPAFNETDEGKDIFKTLLDRIVASRRNGGMKAQEIGDGASDLLHRLNLAESKVLESLPNIRNGRIRNALTPQQRLKVWDRTRKVLDKYTNVTAQANYTGDKIGNWVMLNRSTDGRYADAIIDLLMPFGFFRSRMGSRLLSIPVNKPGLVNLYYETQGAIDDYHEGAGTPVRLQGSIPVGGKWFMGNPLAWAIPFNVYAPDPYTRPRPEDGDIERRVNSIMQWMGGTYPLTQAAVAATLDMVEPKKDGTKRIDDFELGDIIPSYRTAGYIIQSLTGMTGPGGYFKWGDQWDPYRAKRTVGAIAAEDNINPVVAQYAQQVIQNRYDRKDESNNVDPTMLGKAIELADRAMQETGSEQAISTGTSLGTGVPIKQYREGEKEMREASQTYNELKYDPNTNPYGSKAAAGSWMDSNPALASWWTKDDAAPGDSGRLNTLYGQKEKLQTQQKAAEEAAVQALDLSAAGRGDIYDARAAAREPFTEQIDAINAEIDDIKSRQPTKAVGDLEGKSQEEIAQALLPGNLRPFNGMNPQEVSQSFAQSVMWQARQVPGKPEYPGDDATRQQWDAYNKQRAEWEKKQEEFIVNSLTQVPTSDVIRERRGPVNYTKNQAIELWWHFNHDRETPGERARLETLDRESAAYEAASQAQMQSAKQRIKNGDKLLQQYLDTPKGDERIALKDKDWRYDAALMAAYNPDVYDAAVEQFGQEALADYWQYVYKWPTNPGEGATEAELQAYYDARDQFNVEHPELNEVMLWMKGRNSYAKKNQSEPAGMYDMGSDYAKAIETFTPRIFDIERAFNEASANDNFVAYRNSHQADYALLVGYREWQKALLDPPQSMGQLPTARWGFNPATANASYATDADRNAYPGGMGRQQSTPQPFDQGNLPFMPTMALGNQGQAQPSSGGRGLGASSLGTTQDVAGVNPPESEGTPRSAEEWARENEKYAKYEEGGGAGGGEWSSNWDEYLSLEDNDAKRQYLLDNPEFADEYLRYIRTKDPEAEAWWLKERTPYTPRSYSYGGGWGGGGGGGGGYTPTTRPPQINPRYMDRGLWDSPMQGQRQWIPYSNPTPDWLRAGDRVQPDPIRKWQRPRF